MISAAIIARATATRCIMITCSRGIHSRIPVAVSTRALLAASAAAAYVYQPLISVINSATVHYDPLLDTYSSYSSSNNSRSDARPPTRKSPKQVLPSVSTAIYDAINGRHYDTDFPRWLPPMSDSSNSSRNNNSLTLCLDLDGTLIASERSNYSSSDRSNSNNGNSSVFDADRLQCYRQYFETYSATAAVSDRGVVDGCQLLSYSFTRADRSFDLYLQHTPEHSCYVTFRPHLKHMLQQLQQSGHELLLFTASQREYADAIVDALDTTAAISHRLYSEHISAADGCKHLSRLGRPLQRLLLIDDRAYTFATQPANGVHIACFYHQGNKHAAADGSDSYNDTHLLQLLLLLTKRAKLKDARDKSLLPVTKAAAAAKEKRLKKKNAVAVVQAAAAADVIKYQSDT